MNSARNENIWDEINHALHESLHEPMDDERTITQLAEEWGIKRDHTYTIVNRLVKAGVLLVRRDAKLIYVRPNPDAEDVAQKIKKALIQQ